jgi:hypothetical protein
MTAETKRHIAAQKRVIAYLIKRRAPDVVVEGAKNTLNFMDGTDKRTRNKPWKLEHVRD